MKNHKLPLSVSFPPLGLMNPPEAVRFLHDHGFDSMDFNFVAALNIYGKNWQDMIEEVKREADKLGILIISGHLPFRGASPEELHESVLESIKMAGALGIERAVLHPLGNNKMPAGEENHNRWFNKNIEYYNRCENIGYDKLLNYIIDIQKENNLYEEAINVLVEKLQEESMTCSTFDSILYKHILTYLEAVLTIGDKINYLDKDKRYDE